VSERLRIEIDPKGSASPSEQIARQVRFAIAAGRLARGERLPSVRALAADAVVNPNTVGKVWRDLEREGVLETRPGDGVFVAAGAAAICAAARNRELRAELERCVGDALASGLERAELEAWFDAALARRRGRSWIEVRA
jgi:GntR family transcriptional regulator